MRRAKHRLPGIVISEHEFSVPLDHGRAEGDRITVFAREVVAEGRERDGLPWLVFLQGGPGHEAPRPDELQPVWLPRALEEFRVLLLDQRGTGLSTPVDAEALASGTPQEQAEYLTHFRADSIVRDAELIRRDLAAGERWSILGQSYGGFCALTYLSLAPQGLRAALFTGGLAPLDRTADEVYRATYRRVLDRNRRFYERYPEGLGRVRALARELDAGDIRLPDGSRLTSRRLRAQGMVLGMTDGGERLHYLVERGLGYPFLRQLQEAETFEAAPIYAVLHEAIYCQGQASRWSAQRVAAEFPELDEPTTFTGEMVYPWMFDDFAQLRPLREAAHLLAEYEDWPRLYAPDVLRQNDVPCAAAIYADDLYVERVFSEETAATVRGLRAWVTDEYQHDALRKHGDVVLDRLLSMLAE